MERFCDRGVILLSFSGCKLNVSLVLVCIHPVMNVVVPVAQQSTPTQSVVASESVEAEVEVEAGRRP
jgi:hypothetical protein